MDDARHTKGKKVQLIRLNIEKINYCLGDHGCPKIKIRRQKKIDKLKHKRTTR
jgi:hypothetical protein